ncbi:ricin-type beta-trefoil lectin domain protein [Kutzneria kofuensis]|uniref:Dienelactone hydrolase n=1 Tax=Kutzneria kofuensis TaxID=103725 RepID=A0A7W9NN03_9PSEU|nr:ricin-type beta-trefoil lectin domain protein [Kutzneria kofuensis]MBB5897908.1 dienelactone hydrolase [Kutzneria kofuensis]
MRRCRTSARDPGLFSGWTRAAGLALAVLAAVATLVGTTQPATGATAAPLPHAAADNPYQRGPDPTIAMIESTRGPFATASVSVPPGNGFNGGMIYYPTDTSQGTWGALAIVPGYTALFANEEAWMGPWLSSFGFVVIGVETNSRTDFDTARGTQLLAALDYLTTKSPVHDRVDPNRLSVLGHSMGGGGVVYATEHRPSLKAAVALAPFSPSQNMSTDTVPTMVIGGQNDTVVTPSYVDGLYATLPATTPSDFAQIAGADHVYYTHPNNVEMKLLIPWLKTFVDNDTRYTQFLCPTLPDPSTVSAYRPKCPYVPGGGTTPPPTGNTGPLHAVGAGKCLNAGASGSQAQIQDCTGGASQVWTHTDANQLSVTNGSQLCLDASGQGTSPGTKVITWACNGQPNQQWTVNSDGTVKGVQSGLCLDVSGASTASGALVQLWTCNGQPNQQWRLG